MQIHTKMRKVASIYAQSLNTIYSDACKSSVRARNIRGEQQTSSVSSSQLCAAVKMWLLQWKQMFPAQRQDDKRFGWFRMIFFSLRSRIQRGSKMKMESRACTCCDRISSADVVKNLNSEEKAEKIASVSYSFSREFKCQDSTRPGAAACYARWPKVNRNKIIS